jgi:hypothetical protein
MEKKLRVAARATLDVLTYQPWVGAWLGVALLTVVVRTSLLSVPEKVPGSQRWGEVAFDLAIAYIAAFLFNLLVIEVPRRRLRPMVKRHIQRLAQPGFMLRGTVLKGVVDLNTDTSTAATLEQVLAWTTTTNWSDSSGAVQVVGGTVITTLPISWKDFIVGEVLSRNDSARQNLTAYFGLMDVRLLTLV